ncbi:undecaprenyl-phosphate glucose phosphotransferase [Tardiphaga sp. vice154]|uniref:undecaprenyl-phosphate glucose phosphotransferase n=1 Tax=Tardiphaga sp. vice154 TaxID=2592814 RepID=UPI0011658054|nr:undecaprenyl-phosphate glucose phosphotransferase [Tardiphaga sp. vice154]QDM22655.1 undecaprenyl-phosphate glucose phosphotransferase [Tardiphaga sp. vice154]
MTEISEVRSKAMAAVDVRGIGRVSLVSLEIAGIFYDAAIVVAASVIGGLLYHITYYGVLFRIEAFLGIGLVAAVLHMLLAKTQNLYEMPVLAGLDRSWTRLLSVWILVVLLLMLFIFLLKIGDGVSRGSTIAFGLIGGAGLVAGRALLQRPLRRAIESGALGGRRIVLVGSAAELAHLRSHDLLHKFGLTEVRRFVIGAQGIEESDTARCDMTGVSYAIEMARVLRVDEIVVAIGWDEQELIQQVRDQLRWSPLPVHLLPDQNVERFLSLPTVSTGPLPTWEFQRAPLSAFEQALKRSFDLCMATIILVTLSPLLLLTALAIKLDSAGPVIFRQQRKGFNGEPFSILKFRTMKVVEDGAPVVQARRGDARVTRVGRTLRRRSIDELPQLINVIRGDMSLVGPRPHVLAQDDKYSRLISSYAFRHHVKPGITGLAQVHGFRGETPKIEDMQKRVEHDLAYVNGWGLWLDIRIIFRTLGEPFRSDVY